MTASVAIILLSLNDARGKSKSKVKSRKENQTKSHIKHGSFLLVR